MRDWQVDRAGDTFAGVLVKFADIDNASTAFAPGLKFVRENILVHGFSVFEQGFSGEFGFQTVMVSRLRSAQATYPPRISRMFEKPCERK